MIEAVEVGKSFGGAEVLRGITFRARPGEVLLLLGGNGAGKTTLLRAILGLFDFEGSIAVDGLDPLREGKAVRGRIGYLPQSSGLHLDLTVGRTLAFYCALRRVEEGAGRARLEGVGLGAVRERRVGELSLGMRQRLGFAVATLSDPPLLLLDEPTASMDAAGRTLVAEELRGLADRGRTILLSTHREGELAAVADRALRLEEGRLAA